MFDRQFKDMTEARIRVAIIDDDESVRKALSRLLRSAGMITESFDCAETFLEHRAEQQTDCLVIDVRMPGMDGGELLQRLTSEGNTLPAIVITAYYDDGEVAESHFPGAVAVLLKPLDDAALLRHIRAACGRDTHE